jgi:hypothetical protein
MVSQRGEKHDFGLTYQQPRITTVQTILMMKWTQMMSLIVIRTPIGMMHSMKMMQILAAMRNPHG